MLLFSDLHLSPRTFDTCMKVLRKVHAEAKRLNVSVGFLGDFFDKVYSQGTLPVDVLNRLMKFFAEEWSVDMIMIPGNHDYFDAQETEHGLTPFAYASKHIRIVDVPSVIGNQLWIPWRRDHEELERILSTGSDTRSVIFGHFDIVGFKLNAHKVSTEGLSATMFPPDIPVYTGHYHTPQVRGNITYIGSPYQLSLSEAEDTKALPVLDPLTYKVQRTLPLDIGPRQYKWSAGELMRRHASLRPSDRVSVTCTQTDLVEGLVSELRAKHVDIQVKRPMTTAATRVSREHYQSAEQLLEAYGRRIRVDMTSHVWRKVVVRLREMPKSKQIAVANPVCPHQMVVSGFGPFELTTTLQLTSMGFTLVTGECDDLRGRSNGAGKSMATAGAWLWACTGHVDGRAAIAFDTAHTVVHHRSTEAVVSVSGTTRDQQEWTIRRSKSAQKHTLRLILNGVDRTRSTLTGTQKAIASELFGLDMSGTQLRDWLLRQSVWSQQGVTRWIDANDTHAKQALHRVANMGVWLDLAQWAKDTHKNAKHDVARAADAVNMSERTYSDSVDRLVVTRQQAAQWETEHEQRVADACDELDARQEAYDQTHMMPPVEDFVAEKRQLEMHETKLKDAQTCVARMQAHRDLLKRQLPAEWLTKDPDKEEEWLQRQEKPDIELLTRRVVQAEAEKRARRAQVKTKTQELQRATASHKCVTCGRTFDNGPCHEQLMERLAAELSTAQCQFRDANKCTVDAEQQLVHAKKKHAEQQTHLTHIQKTRSYQNVDRRHNTAHAGVEELTAVVKSAKQQVDTLVRRAYLYEETKRLRQQLKRALDEQRRAYTSLQQQQCPYDTSSTDVQTAETQRTAMRAVWLEKKQLQEEAAIVLKWTGTRGIQTYAMEHTLQRLASSATCWLQRFFERDDIALQVEFDDKERLQRRVVCKSHEGVMSGGQWRRVQLASFMAWRDLAAAQFPLLVMDEACTSMDGAGIRAVQKTLRQWCEDDTTRSCYFITHEPEQHRDTSTYQHHIKIVHKRGRSEIVDTPAAKRQRK